MSAEVRITTDHHFRGYNYSMLADQRNNTRYHSASFNPSIQPQFVYSTPLTGLKLLFWGNFFLTNTSNRDSDLYILQDGPGEEEKWDPVQGINLTEFTPGKTRRYKERNGLSRYDGLFYGIYYDWNTKYGDWSVGTWMWNNLDRFGKYSWQEYFLWYRPNVLKIIHPTFKAFFNTSFDSGGSTTTPLGTTNGQNYFQFELSHTFFENSEIHVTPHFQAGYVVNNDNNSKRAGVSNIIQSLQFSYENFDLSLHAMYRPYPQIYDTYDSNPNDGRLPDPSLQNGIYRSYRDVLQSHFPDTMAKAIQGEFTSQKFLRTIFFVSIGTNYQF